MKKSVLLIGFALISSNVSSEIIKSKVHSLSLSTNSGPHLLRLFNGRAIYINGPGVDSSHQLIHAKGRDIEVNVDEKNNLLSYTIKRRSSEDVIEVSRNEEQAPDTFSPTSMHDNQVKEIFNRLNDKYQRISQCYNRAHVWAYEEFKEYGIQTEKAWVFFTDSYLKRHQFSWWFHVAPMVKTQDDIEYVLDYRFTFGPTKIKDWTDLWVYTRKNCPVVEKYSDYSQNQNDEDCYIIKTNMYYWQPWHIEKLEDGGYPKTEFSEADIKWSYQEAF